MNSGIPGVGDSTAHRPIDVHVDGGVVRGVVMEGVRTWRGVPYGVAERWKAPGPVEWQGVWPADDYGSVAPQTTYTWKDTVVGDEDCLNLDIVRPDSDEQLPVVVYLHGGGFFAGASHTAVLRGFSFARQVNCVYVAINFRLGVCGYLDMSALDISGSEDLEPNPALKDQLLALKWVQKNIAQFGGDPGRVTLMGESAGGSAASALMASPLVEGLFHRVILQSAPVMTVHTRGLSTVWARKLVQYAGFAPRTVSMGELKDLPAGELVRAGQQMLWRGRGLWELNSCFGNTVDGNALPEHPLQIFGSEKQARVPLLIGTNNDELSAAQVLFFSKSRRAEAARRMLLAHDPDLAADVEKAYGDLGNRGAFALFLADAVFWAQSVRLAELHAQAGELVWMYRFDYAPAVLRRLGIGAMHSMELSALFGDAQASRARILLGSEMDCVTEQMQEAWSQFVWGGSPGWDRYCAPARTTKIFEIDSYTVDDPRRDFREVWENFRMSGWNGEPELIPFPRPGR
ncbi:carboxylesterase/lipase family protein [Corynebacterium anserum]|nr:carboxylesterase family protein [Corynebacterium anserum]